MENEMYWKQIMSKLDKIMGALNIPQEDNFEEMTPDQQEGLLKKEYKTQTKTEKMEDEE